MQKSRWTRGKGALVSARFDTWASVRWRDQYPCRSHCVSVSQVEFVVAFGPPASTGFPCVYIRASGLDRLPPSQSLPITGLPFRRASQVYLLVTVLKPRLGLLVPMRGRSEQQTFNRVWLGESCGQGSERSGRLVGELDSWHPRFEVA